MYNDFWIGTGSSAVLLSEIQLKKENYYINVKNYAAKGDGIADDTAAIQSAINASNTLGGIVFFPEGIYLISSPLVISTDGAILIGVRGKSTVKLKAGVTLGVNAGMIQSIIVGGTDSPIVIDGLSVDGNSTQADTSASGIYMYGINDLTVRNLTVKNCKQRGILLWENVSGTIENCIITNTGGDAGIRTVTNVKISINSCWIHDNAFRGIILEGANKSVVENCRIYNHTLAGIPDADGVWILSDYVNIVNCYFDNNCNSGIYNSGSYNIISQCTFTGGELGCDLYHGSILQSGNKVVNCTCYGNSLRGFSGFRQEMAVIANNVSYNNGVGFEFDNIKNSLLNGNIAFDNQGVKTQISGIYIRNSLGLSDSVRICNNVLKDNLTNAFISEGVIPGLVMLNNEGYERSWIGVPALPVGLGVGNGVVNTQPMPVLIYHNGGVGTSVLDAKGYDMNLISGDPRVVFLQPGDTIYFVTTIPSSWRWYGL